MFCKNCGKENIDGAKFCAVCGAEMTVAEVQPNVKAAPQPQYQPAQPYYNNPVVPGKGMGIAGMILGIVSLALFCFWYLALPCGITGIILSALAVNKAKAAGIKNSMATAGVICSAIALGLAVLFILLVVIGVIGIASASSFGGLYY